MAFPIGSANSYLQLLRKPNFHKLHHLRYADGEPTVVAPSGAPQETGMENVLESIGLSGMHPTQPKWLALDKTILHFFAYLYEGPVESRSEECMRIRYCDIYYYMEDDTVMIMEKLDDRAGTYNGKLLNRQRVPKSSNPHAHISVYDFNVGKPVEIFSRHYFVYKCDEFTRATLTHMGFEVPEDFQAPFSQHLLDSAAEKHLNHRLRRHISHHHTAERFRNFDTKVLRFYGYWDDRASLFGDRHYLVIHHHLGDQTTEVLRKVNGALGKEKLEPFVRRSRIPKFAALPALVTDRDFQCGSNIVLMARLIYLYDCDNYTKWYYKETYGYEQKPVPIEPPAPPPTKPAAVKPPPFNGYGTEEDSLRNCQLLIPKPPMLDVRKYLLLEWHEEDPTVLVFTLRLLHENKRDAGRTFVMSFYLNNDNIYIYEKDAPQGVSVGSFHSRKTVKKGNDPLLDAPQYLKAEDLYIGGMYSFSGQTFIVTAVDEATAAYMEKYPQRFPYADGSLVLEKFTRAMVASGDKGIFERLRNNLKTNSDVMNWNDFLDVLMSTVGNALNPHEYFTLARRYQRHTEASRTKMAQLLRAIIQHHLRKTGWDPTLHLLQACIRADYTETGFLSLTEMLRCIKGARMPGNTAVCATYLDLTTDAAGVDYRRVVSALDWMRHPVAEFIDLPQNIGKDFDYNKYFGDVVPVVRHEAFLEDVRPIYENLTWPK
ncbi:EF-hand domain-containing family member C2-like isoform X2 [Paramacrobiotus metropolitanus]|uniref:EF-hand domain-containing family member C2-like isoform X2 n=1 Tax=Paramacrobiotus metropolitanus TaxID=2943436 RepID=UPI00244602DB|nr:EF-hand domain-containing family member C2-like isoform X2 [Paramacrobiotus metropolitanus]